MYKIQIKLKQSAAAPQERDIAAHSAWIALFPQQQEASLQRWPYHERFQARWEAQQDQRGGDAVLCFDVPNEIGTHVSYACIKPDIGSFELLGLARQLSAAQQGYGFSSLLLSIAGFDQTTSERLAEALLAAIYAGSAEMPNYKSRPKRRTRLRSIHLYGIKAAHGFRRTRCELEGNALARYLSCLPPNELTPAAYLAILQSLSKEQDWSLTFYDMDALQAQKAGAFLAVAQASAERDAGIARLVYAPPAKQNKKTQTPKAQKQKTRTRLKKLILAGKGICYDTGGTNLKSAKYMYGMHEDMQGSAVALGSLLALSQQKVDFAIECWLALATNHIGPKAYKPNDIIKAADGSSIEIVHTDAEGRMVLADTLVLATRERPDLLIDYATLTGACVQALGTGYSGAFTNRDAYIPMLIKAGQDSGERIWPFPMDADYDKGLQSNMADIKQCALEGEADHILAARFLQRFVKHKTPWIHIDLASGNNKGGLAHIPTDTTGFGVRYTLNLLLDKNILAK